MFLRAVIPYKIPYGNPTTNLKPITPITPSITIQKRYACRYYSDEDYLKMAREESEKLVKINRNLELDLCRSRSLLSKLKFNIPFNDLDIKTIDEQVELHKKHREEDYEAHLKYLVDYEQHLIKQINYFKDLKTQRNKDIEYEKDKIAKNIQNNTKELLEIKQKIEKVKSTDITSIDFLHRGYDN